MRLVWILGSAAALTLGLVAGCTDDDDEVGPGTGGAAGGDGTGGTPSGGRGGMGGGLGLACDPQGNAACENETDCPFVTSGQLQSAAYQCGDDCDGEGDPEGCAVDCLTMELASTEECSTCYARLVACADENCFTDCSADPSAEACKQCLGENDCSSELEECGGITIE